MKPWITWLIIALILYAGLFGGYHFYLTGNQRKVLVAVDTSYPMKSELTKLTTILKQIQRQRYSQFTLITDKAKVHGWQQDLRLDKLTAYGPRNLTGFKNNKKYIEIDQADKRYLISNANQERLQDFSDWIIIRLR